MQTAFEKSNTCWYALRTKPRWEKLVLQQLERKEIDVFCPLVKKYNQWKDRKKWIETPIFNGYIFVNIAYYKQYLSVLQCDGAQRFIYTERKPAIVKDCEIANIKKFLNLDDAVINVINAAELDINTKVLIAKGIFMDHEGYVVRKNNSRVYVKVASLNQYMTVEFPISSLSIAPLQKVV